MVDCLEYGLVELTVLAVGNGKVSLGFNAAQIINIYREELGPQPTCLDVPSGDDPFVEF